MQTLIECVPNFSEGRDPARVDAIVAAIRSVPGIIVLDREMDADHNRSVITFAGSHENVGEAAFRAVAKAVELIDLTRHTGAHPRVGAADVVPFVPIEGVTLDDCVSIARQVGERIAKELGVPVYLYEAAATRPERRNLENIRKGQFEGLREQINGEDRRPDFGEPRVHPTAGATVVGARKFLIAYNINLNTPDVEVAKKVAKAVRASSGGLPFVKGMGVDLKARGLAQVSMNLTDFEQTSVYTVFEAVRAEAARHGAEPVESEIIGLIPKRALENVAAEYLKVAGFSPGMILENRLAAAIAEQLHHRGEAPAASLRERCEAFVDAVADSTPTPGGGSVSALAGALAAALGKMVAGMSARKKAYTEHAPRLESTAARLSEIADFMKQAIDRDAASYDAVMTAYRTSKDDPGRDAAIQSALHGAVSVPLEVAERAAEVRSILSDLGPITSPQMASDLKVGMLLADAAIEGARANVEINLESINDPQYLDAVRARLPQPSSAGRSPGETSATRS